MESDAIVSALEPTENPVNPDETLRQPPKSEASGERRPLPQDSAVTSAEKVEDPEPPAKKRKVGEDEDVEKHDTRGTGSKRGGFAEIKPEYLIHHAKPELSSAPIENGDKPDGRDDRDNRQNKKQKGQNTSREFGRSKDTLQLCSSRTHSPEFSPKECQYGAKCKFEHDLRKYLQEGRREDLETFDGQCPVFKARGSCNAGWKCRFVKSHSEERQTEKGPELVLTGSGGTDDQNGYGEDIGVMNVVGMDKKIQLRKKQYQTEKADKYNNFLNKLVDGDKRNGKKNDREGEEKDEKNERRAQYVEPPFRPSEKRRLYYGPETPVLAPLTTQGNLPFRRLCVDLGAQVTWSEMAMGMPLVQGEKSEWALMRAHESEMAPPKFAPKKTVDPAYDNAKDLKFGVQIAGNKPWVALKTTEVVTSLCPHIRAVDLNCGCPIDLVWRQGAGAALLDSPAKLEKILRGMNAVSGEVPVTVKIRMGTKDNRPTADKLVERFAYGGMEANELDLGSCGVQAVTLHGRSRQQRYTRLADWSYISECAAVVQRYNQKQADQMDTTTETDARDMAPNKLFFIGNGDCYSHHDYYEHLDQANVDSVMVARGALIKPWIFEEIEQGQYLDKSSSQRLEYIEKFAKYGMQTWGSDEMGIGTTRRFLLEWLSFACRYIPLGILEHMPPKINERPPAYKGRDDLETLMASDNFKDWIKISEMFLGPAHKDFKFEPKHKSNSYETVEG